MTGDADRPRSSGAAALATTRPRASAVGAGSQDSTRLPPCPADDDASPRSPNRRTRWHSSPRCCGNPPSVNRQHRIAIDSSDSAHARRPPAPPLTPLRSVRLAASSKTRSETHARLVEQGQASPPPTKRGVKPRPGSSSWRPARRRTGRVRTPRRHRKPTTAPTFRCRPLGRHLGSGSCRFVTCWVTCWSAASGLVPRGRRRWIWGRTLMRPGVRSFIIVASDDQELNPE